ncbi:MAG: LuxR C-terminal-related transcriptional regulator [Anaerolineales bacterium]
MDEDSLDMLDELVQGQAYDVEQLATDLLTKAIHEYYQATTEKVHLWESLSERQQQVAALVCLRYTNDQIAKKLQISPYTVKTHVSDILRKFNVRSRYQLGYMLRRWNFNSFDK